MQAVDIAVPAIPSSSFCASFNIAKQDDPPPTAPRLAEARQLDAVHKYPVDTLIISSIM